MIVPKDFEDEILTEYREGGLTQGLKIGCCLDNHWSHVPGQITVVASHSAVGKTTFFIYYFFLLMKKHGLKFLIYSTENSIPYLKKRLIELYCLKKIEDVTDNEYYQAKAFVDHYVDFMSPKLFYKKEGRLMNYKDILNISQKYDHDVLFLDPYTSLPHEGNQYEWDTDAIQKMNVFCESTGKSIYIATHGKTDALTRVWAKGHEFEGLSKPLLPADVQGGGRFINNVHNQFFLHRYTQHESLWNITECHINKFKENDRGGKPTPLSKPILCKLVNNIWFEFLGENGVKENPLTDSIRIEDSIKPNTEFESEVKTDFDF